MMDSSFASRYRYRRRNRFELGKGSGDDDSSVSGSRPCTRDGRLTSTSRLSADSGAGSLEDFLHRDSSPLPTTFLDYWDGVRRHTAPPRKTPGPPKSPDFGRPNTVHAWEAYPSRSAMSKYTPLPAIGLQGESRKYCFQEDSSLDGNSSSHDSQQCASEDYAEDNLLPLEDQLDESDNMIFKRPHQLYLSTKDSLGIDTVRGPEGVTGTYDHLFGKMDDLKEEEHDVLISHSPSSKIVTLGADSDADSDFDDSCESCVIYTSEEDDSSSKPRKPVVRSATFTIEDKKIGEDSESHQQKLLLAVRLPDGSRVSGYFDCRDTLRNVCELAIQNSGSTENLEKLELVTTEVPKRVFSDFAINLSEAGIQDKTLLNLQVCEDSSDSG